MQIQIIRQVNCCMYTQIFLDVNPDFCFFQHVGLIFKKCAHTHTHLDTHRPATALRAEINCH